NFKIVSAEYSRKGIRRVNSWTFPTTLFNHVVACGELEQVDGGSPAGGVQVKERFASVDLGGTKIAAAIACADGQVLAEGRIATNSHEGPDAVLRRIAELLTDLSARSSVQPEALGMGVPGLVDVQTGITQFLPNLPSQWRGVPVGATLSAVLG